MPVPADSKYALKDLYQEIALFDRKIAYCQNYETFQSGQDRAVALQKLVSKREALVKIAVAMAGRGVECDPKYLPRSFKETPASDKAAS
jgi:hypothetical protein